MEGMLCSPAVSGEIPVQRENLTSVQFRRQMDQTRVGEIDLLIPVFLQDALNRRRAVS